jgi:hypothetical protein
MPIATGGNACGEPGLLGTLLLLGALGLDSPAALADSDLDRTTQASGAVSPTPPPQPFPTRPGRSCTC